MRASRGLKWENKMYKLKRSIVGRDVYTRKPQQHPGKLCLIDKRIAQNVCNAYFLFFAVRNNVNENTNYFVLQQL